MDPDGLPVTPGTDARENQNTSNDSNDSTEWPWGRPKREGLVFLEQALASDEPRPSYDGPDPRPNVPVGRHPGAQIFTTPLDAPLITQSVPQMKFTWDYTDPAPRTELDPLTIEDLLVDSIHAEKDDVGSTAANAQAEPDQGAPAKTTNAVVPPRGLPPPRPQLRGILRKKGSSPASSNSRAQGKGAASNPRHGDRNGDRRTVKFQLPQGDGESRPPKIVPARPRRIIKIKSREAVQHWRETQKEK